MHKSFRIMLGVAALGVVMTLAAASHANQHQPVAPVAPPAVAPMPGAMPPPAMMGMPMPGANCAALHNRDIAKCGKDKKCIAKHKKLLSECGKDPACLNMNESMKKGCKKDKKCIAQYEKQKKECPMMMMPMMHGAPGMRPMPPQAIQPRYMPPQMPGVLKRMPMAPASTGKAVGIRPVPTMTYTPPEQP